jgi:NADH dehydrogenase FAD-containing subunit
LASRNNVKNIVIVGASFIGLESASALKKELKDGVNITVVGSTSVAFQNTLGADVGGVSLITLYTKGNITST